MVLLAVFGLLVLLLPFRLSVGFAEVDLVMVLLFDCGVMADCNGNHCFIKLDRVIFSLIALC